MCKYSLILLFISNAVLAEMTQQEKDGWESFSRRADPSEEPVIGKIIVNDREITGGSVFIDTFGEMYRAPRAFGAQEE